MLRHPLAMTTAALLCLAAPIDAASFCGFYVAPKGGPLYNDATQVTLLRDGTTTALSMRNAYRGPAEAFAMVVPVPEVLQKEQVKTLNADIFGQLDRLTAPRLVEYWERDPCYKPKRRSRGCGRPLTKFNDMVPAPTSEVVVLEKSVTVEAQFEVGEYEIVILSATEGGALESWLKDNQYNIPTGARELMQPYIQQGMYFFVAKVNPEKVTFKDGQAVLSPLRFHYTSAQFTLPIRLGLINADKDQDLIVHVIARDRFGAANYPNVLVPTNLQMDAAAKAQLGPFYEGLLAETWRATPGAVITEYAWDMGWCDPCPGPALNYGALSVLGLDEVAPPKEGEQRSPGMNPRGWTVTRLHMRYGKGHTGEDLVFRKASPIAGGQGGASGTQEVRVLSSKGSRNTSSTFQGRYIIKHPWTDKLTCKKPIYGRWGARGGPDTAKGKTERMAQGQEVEPAKITKLVRGEIEALKLRGEAPELAKAPHEPTRLPSCECEGMGGSSEPPVVGALGMSAMLIGLVGVRRRRRPLDDDETSER